MHKRSLADALILLFITLLYVVLGLRLHALIGDAYYIMVVVPVVLASWIYGGAGGLLAGVLGSLLNQLLAFLLNEPAFYVSPLSIIGTALLIPLGGLFGYLGELIVKLRQINIEITHLAAVVNNSDDAILSKDLDGRVVSWNSAAEKLYGYTAKEMIGQPLDRLLPADRSAEIRDILVRIKKGERLEHYETKRLTKDGRTIDISLTVSPVIDDDGRIIGASTIGRDVTKEKIAEAEMRGLLEETRRTNAELQRMDGIKDEFLSIMTHDLKSPLVSILGYSDMLLGGMTGPLAEKQAAFLGIVKQQAAQMQAMIDTLLDYTRAEFGKLVVKPESVDLSGLAAEQVRAFGPEARRRQIAVLYEPAGPLVVTADKNMLTEVVANLIGNALKYTPDGGRVAVSLERKGGEAVLAVKDNGRGLAPDKIARVFDKFFVVEEKEAREKRSLGLGLYISKKFIEANHGRIWAQSLGLGQGAAFAFALPL